MHPGAATTGMAIVTFWANYVRLWTAGDYALLLFVVLALLYIWFLFNDPRDKAMPQVAARLGLHFSRKVSPDIIGAREAEFNEGGREFLNFMRGSIAGRETVIFDHWTQSKSETDVATQQTVVGFRIDPETCFREWGSIRAAHWRAEKMGEWVFVFQRRHLVKPRAMEAFVAQARTWLEQSIDPNWYEPTVLSGFES